MYTRILMATFCVFVVSHEAQAVERTPFNVPVVIESKASGKVLTAGIATATGQFVSQMTEFAGERAQHWILKPVGNSPAVFQIINRKTNQAIEVPKGDSKTFIELTTPTASKTQWWYVDRPNGGARVLLIPFLHTKRALDVPDSTEVDTWIQIYKRHGKENQLWKFGTLN